MSKIKAPQLSIDDPLAQAGQTLLRHYASGLQLAEQAESAPSEAEGDTQERQPLSAKQIKKMRVASRRMRGVLRMEFRLLRSTIKEENISNVWKFIFRVTMS